MERKTTVLVDGLGFPECPRWHDGTLWFCDYASQRVMTADLTGHVHTVVAPPDLPTALGWAPDGRLLVVAATQRRLFSLVDDALIEVADMSTLVPYPCGDMVVDRHGRAYIGNVGFDFGAPHAVPGPGPLLLVAPDGTARIVAEGLAFPNGMVITPDGQTLIVAESFGARLTSFRIESDGSLTDRRTWAQFNDAVAFDAGRFTPDGICLDAEGAVWVASQKAVLRVRAGAQVLERIPLDSFAPACMLGGPDRRTLFILTTDARHPGESHAKGRIETVQVDIPGAGLP